MRSRSTRTSSFHTRFRSTRCLRCSRRTTPTQAAPTSSVPRSKYVIRGEGSSNAPEDIDNIVVSAAADGTPVISAIWGAHGPGTAGAAGAVTRDGQGETVTGVVMMLMGENRAWWLRVRDTLENHQAQSARRRHKTHYDRTQLVQKTISTVQRNPIEGGVLATRAAALLVTCAAV